MTLMRALNHMTAPRLRLPAFLNLARNLGCSGVELRNDLAEPLFSGMTPEAAGALAKEQGVRLFAIAELPAFTDWNDSRAEQAETLIDAARRSGAESIALIPRNDGEATGPERRQNLATALAELAPMLRAANIIGAVEPLGFATAALRLKSEAVDAIESLGAEDIFRLVHDTFHHAIAAESQTFPAHTGIVHISGVANAQTPLQDMTDADRALVGPDDRLNTIRQIATLRDQGYSGPISFEAFASETHALSDPEATIAASFSTIESHLRAEAA